MAKLTLSDVVTGLGGQVTISANNTATELAMENTLSRDGTGPNQMLDNLDMNNFNILNCANIDLATAPTTFVTIETFTTSGVWNKPAGAKLVKVRVVGGGGSGASGRNSAPGTACSGGGGGKGGGSSDAVFLASDLTASPYTITVPVATPGGTAVSAINTDGNNGADGGICSFGNLLAARGGTGGLKGTTSTAAGGTSLGQGDIATGLDGGGGRATVAGVAGIAPGNLVPERSCGGGGGGGGVSSGTTETAGGDSSDLTFGLVYTGAYKVVGGAGSGGAGANGVAFGGLLGVGGGGSGGAGGNAVSGGNGGNGIQPGGGGGGGGGSRSGFNSGAGGAGGAGIVTVTTWF